MGVWGGPKMGVGGPKMVILINFKDFRVSSGVLKVR